MKPERYICTKDYLMEDGDIAFIRGEKYFFYIDREDDATLPYVTRKNALNGYFKHSLSHDDMIIHFMFPIKFGR